MDSSATIATDKFSLEMKPVAKPLKREKISQALATLTWIEPFATKAAQTLRIESHVWTHKDQRWVFLCVSPQKPEHDVWKSLHKIREDFLDKHSH